MTENWNALSDRSRFHSITLHVSVLVWYRARLKVRRSATFDLLG